MKRWIALLLALCLPCTALAQASVTANGVVESAHVYEITAPFTGVLKPFDLDAGQLVEADQVLLEMEPIKLYAPVEGTVTAVFAEPGDLTADVQSQYGMLMSIQKANRLVVAADTDDAYDGDDPLDIRMGERVYLQDKADKENEGEGRIIAIMGDDYTLEVTDGSFEDEDDVRIFRDEKMTSKSRIGTGEVRFADDIAVNGNGRVLRCAVEEGDRVKKGQLLFELAYLDADPDLTTAKLVVDHDGALELNCASGQQVYKGMVLARIHDLSELNVVAEVDEMDLDLIDIGESVTVVFDRYADRTFTATVKEIAHIGIPRQNATYYNVTLSLTANVQLLPGMNATVWLA